MMGSAKNWWRIAIGVVVAGSAIVVTYHTKQRPVDLLDEVWTTVNQHYLDPTFNDYDWEGVRRTYRASIERPEANQNAVDTKITAMLTLLESSHLTLLRPQRDAQIYTAKRYMTVSAATEGVTGATIALNGQTRMPIVLNIALHSPLYEHGVRIGDRLLFYIAPDARNVLHVRGHRIARNGVESDFALDQLPRPDVPKRVADWNTAGAYRVESASPLSVAHLAAERIARQNPYRPVDFASLAITTTLGQTSSLPQIVDLRPGSPVVRAGVELDATVTSLRSGTNGNQVLVVRNPNGHTITVVAPRGSTAPPAPMLKAEDIGRCRVIAFRSFDRRSLTWLSDKVRRGSPHAIILDIRYNGGGYASVMKQVVGLFLPPGTLIGHGRNRQGRTTIVASGNAPPINAKLWLLIGPGSASAAEILAAAIRDAGRGVLIGRRTAGEVLAAKSFPLPHGYAVQVPVETYLDGNGRPIEGIGVAPDITTWSTLSDARQSLDRPLQTALQAAACLPLR